VKQEEYSPVVNARLHPRLLTWWKDDPTDPDRPSLHNPAVQRLVAAIAPETHGTDLGGVMSLNVHLASAGLVLRVHQPFVSRPRLLAVQDVRRHLATVGLCVPAPLSWHHVRVLRCGTRWAELEEYLPHERLAPAPASYTWLFEAMGRLHRALDTLDLRVARPLVATYAPPASLRRWLLITEAAVQNDPEAAPTARHVRDLVRRLDRQWVPATRLPQQLVHGDVRLSNVGRTATGTAVYLDFGFLAIRPRIHDLAYALAFMLRALDAHHAPHAFAWPSVGPLLSAYEEAVHSPLTEAERDALAPSTAAIPLYHAALAGFADDPARELRIQRPFLHLSEWLLAQPGTLWG